MRRAMWFGLFLFGFVIGSFARSANPPSRSADSIAIEIRPHATATEKVITIGDIAEISGGTELMRRKIAKLDLAEFSGNTKTMQIRAKQVDFRLRIADLPGLSFTLKGAMETTIVPKPKAIIHEELITIAQESLQKKLPWPAEELEIKLVQQIVAQIPQFNESDNVTITAEPHTRNISLGRNQMNVMISVNGEKRFALPLLFEVKLVQFVVMTRYPIAKGETLTNSQVFLEKRAIDGATIYPKTLQQVLGKQARRTLLAGHPIAMIDLEENNTPPPAPIFDRNTMTTLPNVPKITPVNNEVLIRAKQQVRMTTMIGSIRVSTLGESLQDGRMGQMIRLQNVESKKVVVGLVTGPGTVEVDSGGRP